MQSSRSGQRTERKQRSKPSTQHRKICTKPRKILTFQPLQQFKANLQQSTHSSTLTQIVSAVQRSLSSQSILKSTSSSQLKSTPHNKLLLQSISAFHTTSPTLLSNPSTPSSVVKSTSPSKNHGLSFVTTVAHTVHQSSSETQLNIFSDLTTASFSSTTKRQNSERIPNSGRIIDPADSIPNISETLELEPDCFEEYEHLPKVSKVVAPKSQPRHPLPHKQLREQLPISPKQSSIPHKHIKEIVELEPDYFEERETPPQSQSTISHQLSPTGDFSSTSRVAALEAILSNLKAVRTLIPGPTVFSNDPVISPSISVDALAPPSASEKVSATPKIAQVAFVDTLEVTTSAALDVAQVVYTKAHRAFEVASKAPQVPSVKVVEDSKAPEIVQAVSVKATAPKPKASPAVTTSNDVSTQPVTRITISSTDKGRIPKITSNSRKLDTDDSRTQSFFVNSTSTKDNLNPQQYLSLTIKSTKPPTETPTQPVRPKSVQELLFEQLNRIKTNQIRSLTKLQPAKKSPIPSSTPNADSKSTPPPSKPLKTRASRDASPSEPLPSPRKARSKPVQHHSDHHYESIFQPHTPRVPRKIVRSSSYTDDFAPSLIGDSTHDNNSLTQDDNFVKAALSHVLLKHSLPSSPLLPTFPKQPSATQKTVQNNFLPPEIKPPPTKNELKQAALLELQLLAEKAAKRGQKQQTFLTTSTFSSTSGSSTKPPTQTSSASASTSSKAEKTPKPSTKKIDPTPEPLPTKTPKKSDVVPELVPAKTSKKSDSVPEPLPTKTIKPLKTANPTTAISTPISPSIKAAKTSKPSTPVSTSHLEAEIPQPQNDTLIQKSSSTPIKAVVAVAENISESNEDNDQVQRHHLHHSDDVIIDGDYTDVERNHPAFAAFVKKMVSIQRYHDWEQLEGIRKQIRHIFVHKLRSSLLDPTELAKRSHDIDDNELQIYAQKFVSMGLLRRIKDDTDDDQKNIVLDGEDTDSPKYVKPNLKFDLDKRRTDFLLKQEEIRKEYISLHKMKYKEEAFFAALIDLEIISKDTFEPILSTPLELINLSQVAEVTTALTKKKTKISGRKKNEPVASDRIIPSSTKTPIVATSGENAPPELMYKIQIKNPKKITQGDHYLDILDECGFFSQEPGVYDIPLRDYSDVRSPDSLFASEILQAPLYDYQRTPLDDDALSPSIRLFDQFLSTVTWDRLPQLRRLLLQEYRIELARQFDFDVAFHQATRHFLHSDTSSLQPRLFPHIKRLISNSYVHNIIDTTFSPPGSAAGLHERMKTEEPTRCVTLSHFRPKLYNANRIPSDPLGVYTKSSLKQVPKALFYKHLSTCEVERYQAEKRVSFQTFYSALLATKVIKDNFPPGSNHNGFTWVLKHVLDLQVLNRSQSSPNLNEPATKFNTSTRMQQDSEKLGVTFTTLDGQTYPSPLPLDHELHTKETLIVEGLQRLGIIGQNSRYPTDLFLPTSHTTLDQVHTPTQIQSELMAPAASNRGRSQYTPPRSPVELIFSAIMASNILSLSPPNPKM